jgi:two-component system, cell cycle response regulator DivK
VTAAAAILIVDDNPTNLKLARVLLRTQGFEVLTAGNAVEALDVMRTCRPRLILMDLQLPGMDGLELTRRLKADPATRSILIIAVTAYAMKGDAERTAAAGCDGYVPKPIDVDSLPDRIRAWLAAQDGTAEPPAEPRSP